MSSGIFPECVLFQLRTTFRSKWNILMMINSVDVSLFSLCVMTALFIVAMSSPPVIAEESFATGSIDNVSEWCHWINDRKCPDSDVRFYLYTRSNINESQLIYIDDSWDASNLSSSFFNPQHPSKIIIHGFRADMFLTPLFEMKTGERREF